MASVLSAVGCPPEGRVSMTRSKGQLLERPLPPRLAVLDGIRGLAILLVLLCHGVFQLKPASRLLERFLSVGGLSWSGVDLFFVLSGFLIGGILLDVKESQRYFRTFYARRAFRILPIYLLLVGFFLVRFAHWRALPSWVGGFSEASVPWFSYLTFTQNIWMAGLGTFGVGTMAATWSLAVEEQFYLTAPFLVRKASRRVLLGILIAVILSAPLLRVVLHLYLRAGNFADYVLMPCRADALSAGILAALCLRTPVLNVWLRRKLKYLYVTAGLLGLMLALLASAGPEGTSTAMVTLGYSALAFFYTCILLIAVISDGLLARVLRFSYLRRLGVLAYFVYLFHLPAMEAGRRLLGTVFWYSSTFTQFSGGFIGVIITIFLAHLSWTYFEGPLVRLGQKIHY